ncbi:hypothetical protein [Micromonospora sp. NPDC047730]|uniref:hypothetical protein n=1 Tax=Micromonospora sp. NPDC047730 TaxID=3364253 RepID=UPI003723BC4E
MTRNLHITSTAVSGETRSTLDVERSLHLTDGTFLRMDDRTRLGQAHFSADDARKLGEWFATRYGVGGYLDAKPGETVKVVNRDGTLKDTAEVREAVDSDGAYDLKGHGYVSAAFVRHADAILPEATPATPAAPSAPAFTEGTPVVIVTDDAKSPVGSPAGLAKGTPAVVRRTTGGSYTARNGLGYHVRAMVDGTLTDRLVRAQDVALTMPAEPATPAPLKVGDVVALKPGAKTSFGGDVYFASDVARVKVVSLPDAKDVYVRAVDGSGAHGSRATGQYVGRAYLGDPIAEAPFAPKVGDVVALKSDARMVAGPCSLVRLGATKVKVVSPADPDGDLFVKALDGREIGRGAYVQRSGLAPLSEAPVRPWAVGDEAIVTEDEPTFAGVFRGDRVRITDLPSGSDPRYRAQFVSGRGRVRRDGGWYVPASALRRP